MSPTGYRIRRSPPTMDDPYHWLRRVAFGPLRSRYALSDDEIHAFVHNAVSNNAEIRVDELFDLDPTIQTTGSTESGDILAALTRSGSAPRLPDIQTCELFLPEE